MNFEVLNISHIKRNIIIGIVVVLVLSAVALTFTRAKYRVTQSVPLVSGTINFSPYDFNVVAMYLNQDGAMPAGQTKEVPKFGYTLDTEQSACFVDDVKDERIEMSYVSQTAGEKAYVDFTKMSQSGTKCTLYFDLLEDIENPIINNIYPSSDDTSITVNVDATDNVGIYYYYYQIGNEKEVQSEEATYTFTELTKGNVYTVTVRIEDASGNTVNTSKEVMVGLNGGDYILASDNAPISSTTDWTEGTTYYYTGNPNNWVEFGGFYWRIIRINGDGTIRMIYQGVADSETPDSGNITGEGTQIGTSAFNSGTRDNMYVGFKYTSGEVHGLGTSSTIKEVLDQWYSETSGLTGYAEYIDGNAGFCGDRRLSSGTGIGNTTATYMPNTRISNSSPSLTCELSDVYTISGSSSGNGALQYPIGLVTADEAMLSGLPNSDSTDTTSYLYTARLYWTMSPSWYHYDRSRGAYVYSVHSSGYLESDSIVSSTYYGVRPVINLHTDVSLTGSGTTSDPFVVVTS